MDHDQRDDQQTDTAGYRVAKHVITDNTCFLCNISPATYVRCVNDPFYSMVMTLSIVIFSRVLRDFMTRYVGRSVRRSIGPSIRVSFFRRLRAVFALLLLPNCLNSLFYHCPCPPARDFGSRVYGLVVVILIPRLVQFT